MSDFPLDSKGRKLIEILKVSAISRARQDMRSLTGLEESIKDIGLIHPITINDKPEPDGTYRLLAGERRLRAHLNLMASKEGVQKFGKIAFQFETDADKLRMKQIEFDENEHREKFQMVEEAEITAELDELKKKKYGEASRGSDHGWTQQKTAELRGVSTATVSQQKKLVDQLKRKPEMRKVIQEKGMPLNVAVKFLQQLEDTEKHQRAVSSGTVIISNDLRKGDCRVLIRELTDNSVDLLLTDPPFGNSNILLEEGSARGEGGGQSYLSTLESSDNMSMDTLRPLFAELSIDLFRVLKPSAHLYLFYANRFGGFLTEILERIGFIIVEPPLIWDKGKNQNAFSGYNYMSRYEPILFGYKPGETRRRLAEPMTNILSYGRGSTDYHSFQKPQDLLQCLIKQSSHPGELVLDPFAGSGSTILAARNLGRSGLGFEVSEKNFAQGQKNLLEGGNP